MCCPAMILVGFITNFICINLTRNCAKMLLAAGLRQHLLWEDAALTTTPQAGCLKVLAGKGGKEAVIWSMPYGNFKFSHQPAETTIWVRHRGNAF